MTTTSMLLATVISEIRRFDPLATEPSAETVEIPASMAAGLRRHNIVTIYVFFISATCYALQQTC
jgi:hypothetical protein